MDQVQIWCTTRMCSLTLSFSLYPDVIIKGVLKTGKFTNHDVRKIRNIGYGAHRFTIHDAKAQGVINDAKRF